MSFRLIKLAFVCGLVVFAGGQTAEAQFPSRGGFGRDSDGNDRSRDEMRRRFEAMRSRSGGGDSRSPWGGGGDSRSRWGGSDRSRSPWGGGGFPGSDRGRGDDRDDDRRGGDDRSRGDRSRSGGDDRDRRSSRSGPQLYVPKPHEPIGVAMPGNYTDGDADGDGQIALFEWRQWRPREVADFMAMDTNKDGFLTARELIIAENNGTTVASTASSSNDSDNAYAAPEPTPTSPGTDADGNRSSEKPSAAEARYVFRELDKNRDGKLSSDEWSGSKSVREAFEKAGIKLDLPLDLDAFLDRYPPNRVIPQLRLPG